MIHFYILTRLNYVIINVIRPDSRNVSWVYEREDFDWGAASDVAL